MERVRTVAGGLKDAEVFNPSKKAVNAWNKLVEDAGGKHLSDEVVKSTQLYKENVKWIQEVNEKGYNILDIGADKSGTSSTFYNMEKVKVYEKGK